MTRRLSRDQQAAPGHAGNGLGVPLSPERYAAELRSAQVLRVRSLYKAKRKEPGRAEEGYVDDGLNAECWAVVREGR